MHKSTEIRQYTRDDNRHKTGVMIAFRQNNKVYIGWSKCKIHCKDKKQCDKFDRDFGIHIAEERAYKYFDHVSLKKYVPHSMQDDFERFIGKSISYFTKDENNFEFPVFTFGVVSNNGI